MPGIPLGEWVLVPGFARLFGQSSEAYIERSGQRVSLVYCSTELQHFAKAMVGIEEDFTRRCAIIQTAACD